MIFICFTIKATVRFHSRILRELCILSAVCRAPRDSKFTTEYSGGFGAHEWTLGKPRRSRRVWGSVLWYPGASLTAREKLPDGNPLWKLVSSRTGNALKAIDSRCRNCRGEGPWTALIMMCSSEWYAVITLRRLQFKKKKPFMHIKRTEDKA